MPTHQHITLKRTATISAAIVLLTYFVLANGRNGLNIVGALAGGILPVLFWLWFWLHEDKTHPEPKQIIFLAFFLGMIAVPAAIFLEKVYMNWNHPELSETDLLTSITLIDLFIWAIIEEIIKYAMAFFAGLRSRYFDEPVDAVMYMISSALGFAALENVLFIFNSLSAGVFSDGFITSQLRFIGASLLHVSCSALIGFAIGFGLCKSRFTRISYIAAGLVSAFALHTVFNYLILINNGGHLIEIFSVLWAVIVLIIFLFEKIKRSECYKVSTPTN